MRSLSATLLLAVAAATAMAQYEFDVAKMEAKKPEDRQDAKATSAPEGAIVLFDGKTAAGWRSRNDETKPAPWKVVDGFLQSGGGDIVTTEKFGGKFRLHVEFRVPYEPNNKGQGRGNSGVYLQGRYEVQVLDSYGIDNPGEGDCGGIYGIAKPKENACKLPTVWQSYDIEFEAPKFADGKKLEQGVITVVHNGIKIHDKVKITKDVTTSGIASDPSTPGPIMLQDHGHPVQFRNLWLMPSK